MDLRKLNVFPADLPAVPSWDAGFLAFLWSLVRRKPLAAWIVHKPGVTALVPRRLLGSPSRGHRIVVQVRQEAVRWGSGRRLWCLAGDGAAGAED